MASLPLDLFRSCKRNSLKPEVLTRAFNESEGSESLYPDYVGYVKKDGTRREPDVTTYDRNGEAWVRGVFDRKADGRPFVSAQQGVSLSDQRGKFGYSFWYYFLLPEGTEIPPSLDVVQTGRDPGHYSIRCRIGMSKTAYQGALDNLARSAIAKSVELGKSSLFFKEGN